MTTARQQSKQAKANAPKVGKSNGAVTKDGPPMTAAKEVAMAKARIQVEKDRREKACGVSVQTLLDEHRCEMVPIMEIQGPQITRHGVVIVAKD